MSKKLGLLNRVIYWVNIISALLLFVSFILPYIPPKKFPNLSLLSLAVSPLIVINIFFVAYWLFKFKKFVLLSLTAIISLISIITVPLIVFKSAEILEVSFMSKNISMIGISIKMFFVVTVPVIIGMVIRRFFNDYIVLKSNLITKVSVILFVIVLLFGIYISEWDKIIPFLTSAGLIATTLNITMMFVGYYVAKIFATGIAQQRCIALECGLQNGTLAVFIATQLGSEVGALSPLIVPTAAYGLVMFATSLIFLFIVKKNT